LVLSSFFVKGDDSRLMINEQILRRIRKLKQNTLYPGLLHNNFQVIKFLDEPNIPPRLPPAGDTPPDSKILLDAITTSLSAAKSIPSTDEWDGNGFRQFEILCWTVYSTLEAPEEDEGLKK
jgi:hypothetical protein